MGLCLFFVLSAYLITSLLLQERDAYSRISVRSFYVRRILRIWPLYFLGLLFGTAYAFVFHQTAQVQDFLWYLLLVGNVACGLHGPLTSPVTSLWTISIEEQFYLIWPWAIRFLDRRRIAICAIAFVVIANITLFILGQEHVPTDFVPWTNSFVQFEMFAMGILLALLPARTGLNSVSRGLAVAMLGPVLWFISCYFLRAKEHTFLGYAPNGISLCAGYLLFAIGSGAILYGFTIVGAANIPNWVARLGKISYGLYVFHGIGLTIAGTILLRVPGVAYWVGRFAIALVFTTSFAVLSYEFIESPFLRLKRRFEFVHSRPV